MAGTRTSLFVDKQPGGMFSIAPMSITTGKNFYVHSGTGTDQAGNGFNPDAPFATVDYAFSSGVVTASKGDVIWVMPGHAETTTTDTELFDMDVAGCSIIGLGEGNLRPTFNLEHADATCVIGSPNSRISNCRFIGGVSDLVTAIDIEATGDGSIIDHCYFADTATDEDALSFITVTAAANQLTIVDNLFVGITGGEGESCIILEGASTGTVIARNFATGDWEIGGFIEAGTAAATNLMIIGNYVVNQDAAVGLCISMHAGSTGLVANNTFAASLNGTESVDTVTAMHVIENYMTDLANASGIISATVTSWT